jgi:hypothetical protein
MKLFFGGATTRVEMLDAHKMLICIECSRQILRSIALLCPPTHLHIHVKLSITTFSWRVLVFAHTFLVLLWVTTYELIEINKVRNEGWIENDLSIIKCHANLKSFPNHGLQFRK